MALYEALAPLRADLAAQRNGERLRWIEPRQYHLTLRFFGALAPEAVGGIASIVEPIAAHERSIGCIAGAPLALPSARYPNVVALPIESSGRLENFAAACNDALAPAFGPPDKPFRAHLTVIRCRRGARVGTIDRALAFPFVISTVGLYESTLNSNGALYTPLSEFTLGLG